MKIFDVLLRTSILAASFALAACGDESNSDASGAGPDPATNAPPVISGAPPTLALAGETYMFLPSAQDPDGDTLTFSIRNRPGWATFSPLNGRFSGKPPASAAPIYRGIVISVTDGTNMVSLPAFDLTVDTSGQAPVNTAPVIGGSPATSVVAGSAYSFTPTSSDADGDLLVFSIDRMPTWATFDATTGRLEGTTTASDVGNHSGIVISVTDGLETTALPSFNINVTSEPAPNPVNQPPVISGTPLASVTSGQAYTFTPTASDPDGDNLVFSITGRPTWATFDDVSGRLYGTPGSAGTFSNIRITVSDGTNSAALPAFSIQVVAAAPTGSATLRWTPPTLNEDGSPINNLAGYRIYYGTSSSNLSNVLQVANPTATSAAVQSLSPATWYFAVRAYNTLGVESALSNVASKTIQ